MGKRKVGGSKPKTKKRQKGTVKLVQRKNAGKVTQPYRIMEDYVAKHHSHLKEARIALAWKKGWKQDADGRLQLGQAKKASELDWAMHKFDLVILLNHEAWDKGLDDKAKEADMDHRLAHFKVTADTDGEPKKDDEGRILYRIRKPPIVAYPEVVERHGLYTHDLEAVAQAAINDSTRGLLPKE